MGFQKKFKKKLLVIEITDSYSICLEMRSVRMSLVLVYERHKLAFFANNKVEGRILAKTWQSLERNIHLQKLASADRLVRVQLASDELC
jgi:hypothetical protein